MTLIFAMRTDNGRPYSEADYAIAERRMRLDQQPRDALAERAEVAAQRRAWGDTSPSWGLYRLACHERLLLRSARVRCEARRLALLAEIEAAAEPVRRAEASQQFDLFGDAA